MNIKKLLVDFVTVFVMYLGNRAFPNHDCDGPRAAKSVGRKNLLFEILASLRLSKLWRATFVVWSTICMTLVTFSNPGTRSQIPAPDYKNPHLPVEQRVANLLGRMTLEEKVA